MRDLRSSRLFNWAIGIGVQVGICEYFEMPKIMKMHKTENWNENKQIESKIP